MTEKSPHQVIAEMVMAKIPKAVRTKLTLQPLSSYTRINDGEGKAVVRITHKFAEFMRGDPAKLAEVVPKTGKDERHRLHDIAADPGDAEAQAAAASESGVPLVGVEEVAQAVVIAFRSEA